MTDVNEVTRTEKAKQDLIDQADYFYMVDSASDASERFLSAAEKAFGQLVQMPSMGSIEEVRAPRAAGLRRWPIPGFRNYLIFYRQTTGGIQIVRVLHGARDIGSLLEEE